MKKTAILLLLARGYLFAEDVKTATPSVEELAAKDKKIAFLQQQLADVSAQVQQLLDAYRGCDASRREIDAQAKSRPAAPDAKPKESK